VLDEEKHFFLFILKLRKHIFEQRGGQFECKIRTNAPNAIINMAATGLKEP
jgi:hypothetical protein